MVRKPFDVLLEREDWPHVAEITHYGLWQRRFFVVASDGVGVGAGAGKSFAVLCPASYIWSCHDGVAWNASEVGHTRRSTTLLTLLVLLWAAHLTIT